MLFFVWCRKGEGMLTAKEVADVILNRDIFDFVSAWTTNRSRSRCGIRKKQWHLTHQETHMHKIELYMVLQGKFSCCLNGRIYTLGPGGICLARAGDQHDLGQAPGNNGLSLYLIIYPQDTLWFDIEVTGNKASPITVHKFPADPKLIEQIKKNLTDIDCSKGMEQKLHINILAHNLHLLFVGVALFYLRQGEARDLSSSSLPEVAIHAVQEYLNSGIGPDTSIKSLAAMAGYSPTHFQQLFKSIVGCTVHRYINDLRIEYYRLHGRNQLKKVTASEMGFASLSAFSRWKRQNLPDE